MKALKITLMLAVFCLTVSGSSFEASNETVKDTLKEINGNELNILTINELKNLSQKFKLRMSFDDKLCYLKKSLSVN